MNGEMYQDILDDNLFSSAKKINLGDDGHFNKTATLKQNNKNTQEVLYGLINLLA